MNKTRQQVIDETKWNIGSMISILESAYATAGMSARITENSDYIDLIEAKIELETTNPDLEKVTNLLNKIADDKV